MSTQTEHLGLHQWEPNDPFLRTDFNEDFAKIDSTVGPLRNFVETSSTIGRFTCTPTAAITVDLGFRPKLVVLATENPPDFGVVVDDGETGYSRDAYFDSSRDRALVGNFNSSLFLTESGFTISANGVRINDREGKVFYYAAFR